MKLYELISFEPKDSKRSAKDKQAEIMWKTKSKEIGNGAFGTALDTGSDKRLNQITKVARTGNVDAKGSTAKTIEEDGFLLWLKATQGNNNPYFPQIHDLKITRDAAGMLSYIVNMQKLVKARSGKIANNDELMESLYDDMFYGKQYGYFHPAEPFDSLYQTLGQCEHAPELIKDEKLAEAMKLIKELSSKYKFTIDLHSGNIMWRITGNRPQLVLLDPLA